MVKLGTSKFLDFNTNAAVSKEIDRAVLDLDTVSLETFNTLEVVINQENGSSTQDIEFKYTFYRTIPEQYRYPKIPANRRCFCECVIEDKSK